MVVLDGEEYLTGDEAASLLRVKRETLYAYVSRGLLKSYRQGIKRQRLYRRAEVEALLRLAPSSAEEPVGPERRRSARAVEVPLAESWIRE
jgi:citrate synthase